MEFETIKKDNRKKWIVGVIAILAITSVVFFVSTRANYKDEQRLNLINTKVNWNPTDLEIVSIQIKDGDSYRDVDTVPTSGYTLSSESYCEVNGSKDTSTPIEYKDGKVTIGVSNKGTKCTLIFDKDMGGKNLILANNTIDNSRSTGTFNAIYDTDTSGKLFSSKDDDGDTYFFAGANPNNWIKFGTNSSGKDLYWRIIRINGDGSIRIIYNGEDINKEGSNKTIGSDKFDFSLDNSFVGFMHKNISVTYKESVGSEVESSNRYDGTYYVYSSYIFNSSTGLFTLSGTMEQSSSPRVGYYSCSQYSGDTSTVCSTMYQVKIYDKPYGKWNTYTSSLSVTPSTSYTDAHVNSSSSNVKNLLDTWYNDNLKTNYSKYIDTNAGFCGDRTLNSGSGYGTMETVYSPKYRAFESSSATYKCTNSRDLYTLSSSNKGNKILTNPIGLISVDEVMFAGAYKDTQNQNFWLRTNYSYWTMSPSHFSSNAYMNTVNSNGGISPVVLSSSSNIRPVINLKADTMLIGEGTTTNPYTVEV